MYSHYALPCHLLARLFTTKNEAGAGVCQSVSFTQSLKQLIMSIIIFEFSQLFFHNSLISRCGARRTRDGRVAIGGIGGVGGAGGGGGVGRGGVSVSASASASAVQAAIRAVAVLLVVVAAVCLALAAAVSARLRSHVAASKKPPHTTPNLYHCKKWFLEQ